MRGPTQINRRGGGPLPENNDWAHLHAALQHALSGIDAELGRGDARVLDRGPRRTAIAEEPLAGS